MSKFIRIVALAYAAIVGLLAVWAAYSEFVPTPGLREMPTEPEFLLFFAALPMSATLRPLYNLWPHLFSGRFADIVLLTAFGAFQAALLYLLSARIPKTRGEA